MDYINFNWLVNFANDLLAFFVIVISGFAYFKKWNSNGFDFDSNQYKKKLKKFILMKNAGIFNKSYFKELKRVGYVDLTGIDTTKKINKKICTFVERDNIIDYWHFKKARNYLKPSKNKLMVNEFNKIKIRNYIKIAIATILFFCATIFALFTNGSLIFTNYLIMVALLIIGYIFIVWSIPFIALKQIIRKPKPNFIVLSK